MERLVAGALVSDLAESSQRTVQERGTEFGVEAASSEHESILSREEHRKEHRE